MLCLRADLLRGGACAGPTSVRGPSRRARGCRAAVAGPEGQDRQDRHRKRGHQHKPNPPHDHDPPVSAAGETSRQHKSLGMAGLTPCSALERPIASLTASQGLGKVARCPFRPTSWDWGLCLPTCGFRWEGGATGYLWYVTLATKRDFAGTC